VLGIVDPPALYIPAYGGHPDVGLTNPGALTDYTGPQTLETDDYEDLRFTGEHYIGSASTFTNCHFIPNHDTRCIRTNDYSGHSTFTDCEFGLNGDYCDRAVGIRTGGSYTALRCNAHDVGDAFKLNSGCIIRMCHVHHLNRGAYTGAHPDCVQASGAVDNVIVEYNNLDGLPRIPTDWVNASVIIKPDFADQDGLTFHNNYLNGGGFTAFFFTEPHNCDYVQSNLTVTDNIFGPDNEYGTHWVPDSDILAEWSGNVDYLGDPVTGFPYRT